MVTQSRNYNCVTSRGQLKFGDNFMQNLAPQPSSPEETCRELRESSMNEDGFIQAEFDDSDQLLRAYPARKSVRRRLGSYRSRLLGAS